MGTGPFLLKAAAVSAALLLAGCGFEAPPPERTAPRPTPPAPLSNLTATLTLSAADIERRLNAETADHLADIRDQPVKCGIGRCRLSLEAIRTGAIRVDARGDALETELPFDVHAQLALPGFLSAVHAKANARGLAMTQTTATLGPDWRIRPTTRGMVQLDDSHLRVGPVVTNLRDVWNDNDELLSRPLFKMLDKKIAAGLNEQPTIAKAWNRAFTAIKVGKKPVAWLVLEPQRLRVGRLQTANGALVLSLGIAARAHVVVQDEPPQIKPAPLPPLAPLQGRDDRFAFAVPVLVSYDEAAKLALQSLAKRPPRVAGMALRFEKLAILPSGQDVILAATFCADQSWDVFHWFSACGTGYLRGAPEFDAATSTIRIRNVRYDVATENVILGAARWLAGPALGHDLESHLVFRAAKDIDKLKSQITAALAKPQGRDVVVSAAIEAFGPPTLTWTKDGFLATFSAEGRVKTDVRL